MKLDLNADLGEGVGDEAQLMPLVSSASIACGAHAGNAQTMRESLARAKALGLRIGAHPGFADPGHFGRRRLERTPAELRDELQLQLRTFKAIADELGAPVAYLKLHGALHNMASEDPDLARRAFAAATDSLGPVAILAMDGTAQVEAAEALGLPVIREAYADRGYTDQGLLVPRDQPGALLHDIEAVVARALRLARGDGLVAVSGKTIPSGATSLCVHGDTPGALQMVRALRSALSAQGVAIGA